MSQSAPTLSAYAFLESWLCNSSSWSEARPSSLQQALKKLEEKSNDKDTVKQPLEEKVTEKYKAPSQPTSMSANAFMESWISCSNRYETRPSSLQRALKKLQSNNDYIANQLSGEKLEEKKKAPSQPASAMSAKVFAESWFHWSSQSAPEPSSLQRALKKQEFDCDIAKQPSDKKLTNNKAPSQPASTMTAQTFSESWLRWSSQSAPGPSSLQRALKKLEAERNNANQPSVEDVTEVRLPLCGNM